MSEDSQQNRGTMWRRRVVVTGLFAAAVGIAAGLWVINGGGGGAVLSADCVDNPAVHRAIDTAAQGQLAALQPTATGNSWDDLPFLAPDGAPTGLADLRGRVLLVNFWATWCVPCRAEMPALSALEARFGGDDFAVITVNLDQGGDGPDKGRAFLDEIAVDNLPFYHDPSFSSFELLRQRGAALGLPATLLVGPDGCEWGVMAGPADWDTTDGHGVVVAALAAASL